MSAEENKAVIRKLYEELSKGNIDAWDEAISPDYITYFHGGNKTSAEQKDTWNRGMISKEVNFSNDDMIAEGDRVVTWMTVKWGEGEKHSCLIYRFAGGKIIESWNMVSIQSEGKGPMLPFD